MAAVELLRERARAVARGLGGDVPSPCISVCRMDAGHAACARAAFARSTRSRPGAAWTTPASARSGALIELRAEPGERRERRQAMKQITFYLDFISPYAYLAFEQLPAGARGPELQRRLPAGAVRRLAQAPRPARPGRDRAQARLDLSPGAVARRTRHGIPMRMPAAHPFNPLPLLRLALAACGRRHDQPLCVPRPIFRHVWRGGADAGDAARLQALAAPLAAAARSRRRRGEGRAEGQHRRSDRARRVRRADVRGRRQAVLGLRCACRCCAPTSTAMPGSTARDVDRCRPASARCCCAACRSFPTMLKRPARVSP